MIHCGTQFGWPEHIRTLFFRLFLCVKMCEALCPQALAQGMLSDLLGALRREGPQDPLSAEKAARL